MSHPLTAPFPYFGGKRAASDIIWQAFGADVATYLDPFCGSLAVPLARPHLPSSAVEIVNDIDGMITNFWRGLQADPEAVARWATWPINEIDLQARHRWLYLQRTRLTQMLACDPEYFDAKVAGWWVWGMSQWIGGGWCSDRARVESTSPHVVEMSRRRPRIERPGGVHAQHRADLEVTFRVLADRLAGVRVLCGDWARVLTRAGLTAGGTTAPCAILLDPPYSDPDRDPDLYPCDDLEVASDVRRWCAGHGQDERLRIVLCGYEGEHDDLEVMGWSSVAWTAHGGYSNRSRSPNPNRHRERLWMSPGCLGVVEQLPLLGGAS